MPRFFLAFVAFVPLFMHSQAIWGWVECEVQHGVGGEEKEDDEEEDHDQGFPMDSPTS